MLSSNLEIYDFKDFSLKTLKIDSEALKSNPLGDSPIRYNPVLIPKKAEGELPVVIVLSGYTGNGPKYFAPKTFEKNMVEVINDCAGKKKAPQALYVFIDAMTFWGGSQFVNSEGTGNYEEYIINEIVPAIKNNFDVKESVKHWCVTGGSSGGYGALHLVSKYPEYFAVAGAIAPDSFFKMSLLPEIYAALPYIEKVGGIEGVKSELINGKLLKKRDSHTILNAVAMGICYAPKKGGVDFPVDPKTGELDNSIWKRWKDHDPIHFLKKRSKGLSKVHKVYLEVGKYDQFHLQYGARQIRDILKNEKVSLEYNEFDGNHWDISLRRPMFWEWLKKLWG